MKCPPSCNTGGKVPVSVDWLNFTWRPDVRDATPEAVAEAVQGLCPGVVWEPGKGMHGYEAGLRARERGLAVCWGGATQAGTAWFQASGEFFKHLQPEGLPWLSLLLHDLQAAITRIDLCADFFEGEYTVDEALEDYKRGEFKLGGRNPSAGLAGDWISAHEGRTLYVGKRKNGKLIRVYEKAKQLGDLNGKWVRAEVEFRNVDRALPLAMLDDPAPFFAGAANWPFSVCSVPVRIKTRVEVERIAVAKLTHESRRAYGALVYQLRGSVPDESLLDMLERPGIPRRLVGLNGEQLRSRGNAAAQVAAAEAATEFCA